jgi:hypothetical protein
MDEKVIQTLKVRAIADMANRGIKITPEQNKVAVGIFPKVWFSILEFTWSHIWHLQVAGLARRLHDNTTLGEQLTLLAQALKDVIINQTALAHRVPTCWNSEKKTVLTRT